MRTSFLSILLFTTGSAVHAQWTRIEAVPPFDVPSLHISGDALLAGTDSAVFRTDDNGQSWIRSATVPNAPIFLDAIRYSNGNLYVGTGGDGAYSSSDDGATWQPFSNGLVGLGSGSLSAFALRDGDLYCGTVGAGVFLRSNGAWQPFDNLAGMNAGNVDLLKTIGDTLWAGAGGNGFIWRSLSGTSGFEAFQVAPVQGDAHQITDIIRHGDELLVGGTYGIFRSGDSGVSWTSSSAGLPGGGVIRFMQVGSALYALRSTAASELYRSLDDGHTWQLQESLPYCYAMVHHGGRFYAARLDGLWVRDAMPVGLPPEANDDLVRVYPNPVVEGVTIERMGTAPAMFRLFDPKGNVLREGQLIADRTRLSIGELASGTYVLQVVSGNERTHRRIVLR